MWLLKSDHHLVGKHLESEETIAFDRGMSQATIWEAETLRALDAGLVGRLVVIATEYTGSYNFPQLTAALNLQYKVP